MTFDEISLTCWYDDKVCPFCKAATCTNGRERWCERPECDFRQNDARTKILECLNALKEAREEE